MYKNKYELNVLVNGKPLREYFAQGRFFVEARAKTDYTIKLKNHGCKKLLAVITVDGVDVIKGKSGSDVESGYVVNPFSTLNVNGYRIDDNNVASFKFDDGKTSYASLVENDFSPEKAANNPSRNNGVIGVRIWEEKEGKFVPTWKNEPYIQPKTTWYGNTNWHFQGMPLISGMNSITGALNFNTPLSGCSVYRGSPVRFAASGCNINYNSVSCSSFTSINEYGSLGAIDSVSLNNYTPDFELGTAWGKKVEDKVVKTKFEKTDSFEDLEIFYLTREELVKMGIDVENAKKVFVSGFPEAFGGEYCKKPSNWNS